MERGLEKQVFSRKLLLWRCIFMCIYTYTQLTLTSVQDTWPKFFHTFCGDSVNVTQYDEKAKALVPSYKISQKASLIFLSDE